MATALTPTFDIRSWERSRSSQSKPGSENSERYSDRLRSPNAVKAKPAKPAVINSILEALDTLDPSQAASPATESSLQGVPTIARPTSSGFGVHYGTAVSSVDDEDSVSDAASPPTIHTSRPPSGLSLYNPPRTASFTGESLGAFRPSSIRSQQSSYSSTNKKRASYSKNKLSAESWVKHNSMSQESLETAASTDIRRSLRRRSSQESLRLSASRSEPSADQGRFAESPTASRAEQIIPKTTKSPLSSSRGRLYLNDSSSNEEHATLDSPAANEVLAEIEGRSDTSVPSSVPSSITEQERKPFRLSPLNNIIIDSVPTRTSSLRHSGSPASIKKREKKLKRQSEKREASLKAEGRGESKVDSVMETKAKVIPESSWADLGEEDGTVRRIRELQEQRKSRLLESHTRPADLSSAADVKALPTSADVESPSTRRSEDSKRLSRPRPATIRAATEPPVKAHKVLGIVQDKPISAKTGQDTNGNAHLPDFIQWRDLSLEEKRLSVRPTTKASSSPIPPLSLDYSYAEAVDALHSVERELTREKHQPVQAPVLRPSLQIPRILSGQYPGTKVNLVPKEADVVIGTPASQRSIKSQRRKTVHPDLPVDFEKKKGRRKSTSDARQTRHLDNEVAPPLPRRNSLEIAVIEYLQDARFSRRVKHPLTGRVIAFSEVGDRNGAAVFVCVGMGLTRYVTAFYDELATTLRLRLITVDRPGVGGSEPYPPADRSGPLNWPDDVLAICQSLGITKFSMLAHSAGAIYSLATALVLPHMVEGKIHLLAPWIPPSQLEAISHPAASAAPAGALPRSQRILRVLPTPFLRAANSSFMTATSASLKPATKRTKSNTGKPEPRRRDSSRPRSRANERPATRDGASASPNDFQRRESMMMMDQFMPALNPTENFPIPVHAEAEASPPRSLVMSATATPMDPSFEFAASALNAAEHSEREREQTEKERKLEYTNHLTQRTWELAVRDSNPATDLLVCLERHRNVGFRYTDVNRELVVTHGSEDKRVPLANVKWLTQQMTRRALSKNADPGVEGSNIPQSRDGSGGCELRILEGESHGLMASPTIMGDVLTEIAGYWTSPSKSRAVE
ncbi:hypothetical protein LTR37_003794 [Vermiconidia calcicola]|uniref:Uncharacterized protein n=1 Tax=Vermiconidia calcicola TaxID=1690605 RepID=A0ACC3NRN5_9PEZI|nr:hypothetical protein LTR37_003794 [Vermiconidia calcicola]